MSSSRIIITKGVEEVLTLYLTSVADSHDSPALDALLSRVAAGDRDALALFYEQTRGAVYGYALSILRNEQDALDAVHDSYLLIVKNASKYKTQGKPMAWVFTIVKNTCLQQLRVRRKTDGFVQEQAFHVELSAEMNADDRLTLTACMEGLSEEERQIVVLHAVAGLRHREIAQMMDLPLATVLSKYHRSLKKLRAILEKE